MINRKSQNQNRKSNVSKVYAIYMSSMYGNQDIACVQDSLIFYNIF